MFKCFMQGLCWHFSHEFRHILYYLVMVHPTQCKGAISIIIITIIFTILTEGISVVDKKESECLLILSVTIVSHFIETFPHYNFYKQSWGFGSVFQSHLFTVSLSLSMQLFSWSTTW